ncbi:hypothetical protein GGX14DRAFT_678291 [Mycena pura]|uniref:CxC1-like cysteine cluster associated with KDZ transposases domain-containing protein n=1 Tax=Mycena pura TaxID=153505 RepID=A0AAD6UTS0_9AGAR|nr:hypothetical protein GGX14DRAFT_678291 [Mycena pura]
MARLTKKERQAAAAAAATLSYTPVPGPKVPHHNKKIPEHLRSRPDIYLADGRTLEQPRLPPLFGHMGETNERAPNAEVQGLGLDDPDLWAPERTPPPQESTQHSRKRAAQWRRWQEDVIPTLIDHYVRLLHQTKSLRDMPTPTPCAPVCSCGKQSRKVAIVRFTCVEDMEIKVCPCSPAVTVQLMQAGAFACAPLLPSVAVDLRVLEFTTKLFVHIAPNTTAFSEALERALETMGFQLDHRNSLRRRFGNALQWYAHLQNQTKARYRAIIDALRPAPEPATDRPDEAPVASRRPLESSRHNRGRQRDHRTSAASVESPLTPTDGARRQAERAAESPTRKRPRDYTPECPPGEKATSDHPPPFAPPKPRARPSNYLRSCCPACFGDLRHDGTLKSDVVVCIDACFTQKKKKSPRDPPKTHPSTHFVPEEHAAQTEEYVDGVRGSKPRGNAHKRPRVEEVDENDDDYEHPDLLLPRSVLDSCEASFKAADEKRGKASTEFFDDTALMALLCHHDRVLWIVNMHSRGEKHFNVIALLETLYQHLQLDVTVGALYDVACALERACRKWGFLARYMDRLAFAVSVFHAFGHEWACQIVYHPRKRTGFGLSDGEGCERFWHSISHLIAALRISGYHNRLYTLDTQIEHAHDASLLRLGEWVHRRHRHSKRKRAEAARVLQDCGQPVALLRAQWLQQVKAQTKPLPRQSKRRGQQAVQAVILLRTAVKARQAEVAQLRLVFLEAVDDGDADADVHQMRYDAAVEALSKAQKKLRDKEAALGVVEHQELKKLGKSNYIRLRMNARAILRRMRDRLRSRKFELDRVERSFRRLVNDNKLYSHTEAAVKRREPTISKLNTQYNKVCAELSKIVKDGHAPAGSIAPRPIKPKQLWQLDVDDDIWQDIGLDDDDDVRTKEPPLWLCDERVRSGIKAVLELDRCDEEDYRLITERCSMQVWFAEEWEVYQFELMRDKLVRLCATWQKSLPDLGVDTSALPPWGPDAGQVSRCIVDGHLPARGADRHYASGTGARAEDEDDEEDDIGWESCGEEEDFGTLDAIQMADSFRNADDDDNYY